MYQKITQNMFIDEFAESGKYIHHGFSYDGLDALYDYLTELEEDCGRDEEFDLVAIRCDYSEYESLEDAAKDYGMTSDELYSSTVVLDLPQGGVVIENF